MRTKVAVQMKFFLIFMLATLSCQSIKTASSVESGSESDYPTTPDKDLTPGTLCKTSAVLRYKERIPYCERDVGSWQKDIVFDRYSEKYGTDFEAMDRKNFKVDHYISLCAGGGNDVENLWPQHLSLANRTDVVEKRVCDLLSCNRINQKNAIELITTVKRDPSTIQKISSNLERLVEGCRPMEDVNQ